MRASSLGKLLVSVVALYSAFGSYIFDWNATHIYNPHWPPHAKFHNAQPMLSGTALGLLTLGVPWRARFEVVARLQLASILTSLSWLTQAGSALFPGKALIDPEFAQPGQPPVQLIVDGMVLARLPAGYWLERAQLR